MVKAEKEIERHKFNFLCGPTVRPMCPIFQAKDPRASPSSVTDLSNAKKVTNYPSPMKYLQEKKYDMAKGKKQAIYIWRWEVSIPLPLFSIHKRSTI